MGAKSEMKSSYFIAPAALALSLFALDKATCASEAPAIGDLLDAIPTDLRGHILNFVLDENEGYLRRSCQKTTAFIYLEERKDQINVLKFDRMKIIPYVGMYMENKKENLDYHETIRTYAIEISRRIPDQGYRESLSRFYANDLDSRRFVDEALAPI